MNKSIRPLLLMAPLVLSSAWAAIPVDQSMLQAESQRLARDYRQLAQDEKQGNNTAIQKDRNSIAGDHAALDKAVAQLHRNGASGKRRA